VHPANIQKMAITTMFGAFEYLRFFGLMNSGATFQRKVDRAVADLEVVFAYVNDMDVASKNAEEHAIHLWQLGYQRREVRVWSQQHRVLGPPPVGGGGGATAGPRGGSGGLPQALDGEGVAGISQHGQLLPPIPAQGGKVVEAAHRLLEGRAQGGHSWEASMEKSFKSAKQLLASAARLAYPVDAYPVDASATHVGACLQQQRPGRAGWEPLAFFSKRLEPAQVKYSAFDRELLACFLGIRHFQTTSR